MIAPNWNWSLLGEAKLENHTWDRLERKGRRFHLNQQIARVNTRGEVSGGGFDPPSEG